MALADFVNNKPIIETERLVLRPMTQSDVSALYEWMTEENIYVLGERPKQG